MKNRLIFIHGNGTLHWSGSWPVWLKKELDRSGFDTFFETFPDSIDARKKYWIPFLKDYVKVGENDVIIGWSSGAVAAMRYAEENKIAGSVLISPSIDDLGDSMEKLSGWYDTPWLWDKIKNNQSKIGLFYGDDDPYIPQDQFVTVIGQLSPVVHKLPGRKHFIDDKEFPELLDYILQTYGNK